MRCPTCGDPVQIRGSRWECGWCGDFGNLSRSAAPTPAPKALTFQLTFSVPCDDEGEENAPPSRMSADEARKRLAKGQFSNSEDICLLILADEYPEELSRDDLDDVSWHCVLDDLMAVDADKGILMWRTLLDAATPRLRSDSRLGEELLYDWSVLESPSPAAAEAFLAALEDETFVEQTFGSAYVGTLSLTLLHLCSDFGHPELGHRCLQTVLRNPHLSPHEKSRFHRACGK